MAKYPAVRLLFLHALGDPLPENAGKDLADALRVEEASTSRWINGESRPKPHRRPALAKYLQVSEAEVREACQAAARQDATVSLSTITTTATMPRAAARVVKPQPGDNTGELLRLTKVVDQLVERVAALESRDGSPKRPAAR